MTFLVSSVAGVHLDEFKVWIYNEKDFHANIETT